MRNKLKFASLFALLLLSNIRATAQSVPANDRRLAEIRHLDLTYSFTPYRTREEWLARAEFLRGRNFEYITAARALGLSNVKIMFKHLLPNAVVATLTFLPFKLSGSITALTALDFLGLGLPPGSASLGELLAQGKANLHAPWLGLAAFVSIAGLLTLLIFVGEAARDALDPRKTFR